MLHKKDCSRSVLRIEEIWLKRDQIDDKAFKRAEILGHPQLSLKTTFKPRNPQLRHKGLDTETLDRKYAHGWQVDRSEHASPLRAQLRPSAPKTSTHSLFLFLASGHRGCWYHDENRISLIGIGEMGRGNSSKLGSDGMNLGRRLAMACNGESDWPRSSRTWICLRQWRNSSL